MQINFLLLLSFTAVAITNLLSLTTINNELHIAFSQTSEFLNGTSAHIILFSALNAVQKFEAVNKNNKTEIIKARQVKCTHELLLTFTAKIQHTLLKYQQFVVNVARSCKSIFYIAR